MRIRKLYGMILFIAILSLGFVPMAGAQVDITVTAPAEVAAGATFDVTVGVDTTVVDNGGTNAYLSGAALGIDYDSAVLEVVGTFGAADGDAGVESDLFNFNNTKVVDSRTEPGTPTEAWPRIGNNDTTGTVLYLSGANAGYDGTSWPFTAGTAKTLFKVKFMVKEGVAADTVTSLSLMQTVPPADSNTGWDGSAAVHPLVGTNEDWATTSDDMTDDFFDIPYVFGAAASITVTESTFVDTDGDGIDDNWENQWFGDLTTANANTDYDMDGYKDIVEFTNDTDPTVRDASGKTDYDDTTDSLITNPDIDGNNALAANDLTLYLRWNANFADAALIDRAIAPGATRTSAQAIRDYCAKLTSNLFDIDGDGSFKANDTTLFLRWNANFADAALIDRAISPGARRTTAAEIRAYLEALKAAANSK